MENQELPMNVALPFHTELQKGIAAPREVWEQQYQNGDWDYLESEDEAAHYQAIAQCYASHGQEHSVLDVGCGTGLLYRHLAMAAGTPTLQYTGIDLSGAALAQAAQRYPQASFLQLDYSNDAIAAKFGCVIFNETLYYFESPLAILEKCVRENMEQDALFLISMYGDHHDGIWNDIAARYRVMDEMTVENARQVRWKIRAILPSG
jgi:SAM-dependent methyltransferase